MLIDESYDFFSNESFFPYRFLGPPKTWLAPVENRFISEPNVAHFWLAADAVFIESSELHAKVTGVRISFSNTRKT